MSPFAPQRALACTGRGRPVGDALVCGLLFAWTGIALPAGLASLAVNILYYGSFMLLPVALCAHRTGSAADALRLNPISVGMMVRISIAAVFCMLIAQNATVLWTALWQALGLDVFAGDAYVRPNGTAGLTLSAVSAAVIAPVCEELLFRGAVLGAWERRGRRRAHKVVGGAVCDEPRFSAGTSGRAVRRRVDGAAGALDGFPVCGHDLPQRL